MLTPVAAAGLGRVRDISHRKRRLADDSIRAQQRRLLRGPGPRLQLRRAALLPKRESLAPRHAD